MPELSWKKSSFSGGDDGQACLELALGADDILHLRESDDPDVIITTTAPKLRTFVLGAQAGEFDHLA
ncbi:DUF397 domain-containing protein [Kitasatospora sp. NPDC059811]|uniref:DUF397 domain-containing protein n=1 Tax=Streptomycetaceae TaxID=2062 RepID=UPI0007AF7311|nr:DUF397 domain-containing protein [Streptomyces sp. MJM8645]